jgi:hypothetical protein
VARYLISFDEGAMTFPEEDLPAVAKAAHAVVDEAKRAGAWIWGGGLKGDAVTLVGTDGSVTDDPYPQGKTQVGGFAVVDVPSREDALEWARKFAVACRCAQDVREFVPDPDI